MANGRITGWQRWVQIGIVLLALFLRLIFFPHRDEPRGFDEAGYLSGSLAVLEGLPAGYKAAPAGPNLWMGWLYLGASSAWHVVHPGPEERAVPLQVRPFVAVDHALFDNYRDLSNLRYLWLISQLLLVCWATAAAFRFGWTRAGWTGGLFVGGIFAVLPLFVDFSLMARPYMTAWALGILSIDAAVSGKPGKRIAPAAVFIGLAIASRIEMLLFAPLVFWEFWYRPEPCGILQTAKRFIGFSIVAILLAAPWLLTHLIGNLRTIVSVRLGPDFNGPTTLAGLIRQLAWTQGLAGAMGGFVVTAVAIPFSSCFDSSEFAEHKNLRLPVAMLVLYVGLLLCSLGVGTIELHQQGAVVLSLIVIGALAVRVINQLNVKLAAALVSASLLLPFFWTLRLMHDTWQRYAPDGSTQWLEQHVPAGTIVYTQAGLQNPLPTSVSANALWDQVTDDSAWRRKFKLGLERFGLRSDQIPRALSDENLVQERGNRRGFFILGGRPGVTGPRFDIRLYNNSPVFGVHDIKKAFAQTGGVVVSREGAGLAGLGPPTVQWVSPSGTGVFIYVSEDLKPGLVGEWEK